MKKILYTFLIIIALAYNSYAFGAGQNACSIKDSAPEELINYIKDVRKIVSNIGDKASAQSSASKKTGNALLRGLNSIISWNDYKTEFDFFLVKPLKDEIPYEVKRDDKYLSREIDRLNKYLSRLVKTGKYSSKISKDDVCSGIKFEQNCNLEGKAGDVIIELINNTKNIRRLLQLSILGTSGKFDKKIYLVQKNKFKNTITKSYSEFQIKACGDSEDGFFRQIKDSIQNISFFNDAGKNATNEWKTAWSLLIGTTEKNDYKKIERDLLKGELARQGVSANGTDAILQNLEDYNNNGGFSLDNNLIENSFTTISDSISTQWDSFKQSVSENFGTEEGGTEKITLSKLKKTIGEVDDTNNIRIEIEELYKRQIPLAQGQDIETKDITAKIIKMHANLGVGINILEKTIPISEKVCRDQAFGKGKCEY